MKTLFVMTYFISLVVHSAPSSAPSFSPAVLDVNGLTISKNQKAVVDTSRWNLSPGKQDQDIWESRGCMRSTDCTKYTVEVFKNSKKEVNAIISGYPDDKIFYTNDRIFSATYIKNKWVVENSVNEKKCKDLEKIGLDQITKCSSLISEIFDNSELKDPNNLNRLDEIFKSNFFTKQLSVNEKQVLTGINLLEVANLCRLFKDFHTETSSTNTQLQKPASGNLTK